MSIVCVSLLTAGITAFTVTKLAESSSDPAKQQRSEFKLPTDEAFPSVGTHFTAYDSQNYPDLTYAAENAVKAVVNIEKTEEVKINSRSYNPFFEFFGIPDEYSQQMPQSQERRSGGSGVIISPDGYVVTNNHVVENASKLKIKLNDNRVFDGVVVGTDPATDIALVKIDAKDLPTLPFGNSDALRLGEWVLAIGSPFDLQSTVTAGIISAKARNLSVIPNDFRIESFIQTDAAVNPGNSGGALVNTRGELVGINTVIKSPTGTFAGYSFAVPVSIVQKVVVDLKEFGMVQRALLGVRFQEINDEFIEHFGQEYGITEQGGVYVASVEPGGAAEAAGIKEGDIITHFDGVKIDGSSTLLEQVGKHRPNDRVNLTLKRSGNVKHFDVVLRNKAGKAELLSKEYVDPVEALGGTFRELTAKAVGELKINGGVQVVTIKQGGILSKARVRKGYIITHINDKPIGSVNDIARLSGKITSIDGLYPDGRSVSYYTMDE